MDNNELKMSKPPITCYLHHAYPLTAATAHKDFYSWFFSNYIQLEFCLEYNSLNFFTCVICGNCIYIPILDYKILDLEFLSKHRINIIDFVINSIDMGYYVTTYFDEFFVPDRISYQKRHMRHESMIYGYDLKENLFRIVGYNARSIYSTSNISFSEFKDSYMNSISKQNDVILFKAKDIMSYQSSFEFDIKNVKNLLQDYLLSNNTFDKLRMFGNPNSNIVYGIQVYREIIKYFQSANTINNQYNLQIPYLLWEHKKTMVSRIKYLIKNGYLDGNNLLSSYIELQNSAEQIKNMILKYNATNNNALIEATTDILEQMYSTESAAGKDLLYRLALY